MGIFALKCNAEVVAGVLGVVEVVAGVLVVVEVVAGVLVMAVFPEVFSSS